MQVFWLRHGTRNFTIGDVPLNTTGEDEARGLSRNSRLAAVETILCSPKKRALMTVTPLAEKKSLPILTVDELDQMKSHESEKEFSSRVNSVLEKVANKNWDCQSLLLCTHSDWLAVACELVATDALDLAGKMFQCAELIEFKIKDGLWVIRN